MAAERCADCPHYGPSMKVCLKMTDMGIPLMGAGVKADSLDPRCPVAARRTAPYDEVECEVCGRTFRSFRHSPKTRCPMCWGVK